MNNQKEPQQRSISFSKLSIIIAMMISFLLLIALLEKDYNKLSKRTSTNTQLKLPEKCSFDPAFHKVVVAALDEKWTQKSDSDEFTIQQANEIRKVKPVKASTEICDALNKGKERNFEVMKFYQAYITHLSINNLGECRRKVITLADKDLKSFDSGGAQLGMWFNDVSKAFACPRLSLATIQNELSGNVIDGRANFKRVLSAYTENQD